MATKSSAAALLFVVTLLLFTAASAQAQAPPEPAMAPPDEDPTCPGSRIDQLIQDALRGREPSSETLEIIKDQQTYLLFVCICSRIVGATGIDITRVKPGAIDTLVKDVVTLLGRQVARGAYFCSPERS
ncbi:unnamed protein product [Urochloa decumbens]|uniref:Uncharacterized protein n=1 Tax=Urochloa decumbens TaxID=240449 RepID=A0ABC9GUI0_9POAL